MSRGTADLQFSEWIGYVKQNEKNQIPKKIKVKKGDTCYSVSKRYYGDKSYAKAIADKNNIKNMKKKMPPPTYLKLPRP